MRFDIGKAIKILFSEENKGKFIKLALFFTLIFLPFIVVFEIAIPGFAGGYNYTYESTNNQVNEEFIESNMLLFIGIAIYTIVGAIVYSIYQYGFYLNIFRRIQSGNYKFPEIDLSHFGPGLKTFGYYLVFMLVMFGLMCLSILLLGLVAVPLSMVVETLNQDLQAILAIIGMILMVMYIVVVYVLIAFLSVASAYIFGVTNSIGKAISIKKMFQATKVYWKSFLMIMLFTLAFSIALNLLVIPLAMIPYIGSTVIYVGSYTLGFILYIAIFDSIRSLDLVKTGVLNAEDLCITPVASDNTAQIQPTVEVVK